MDNTMNLNKSQGPSAPEILRAAAHSLIHFENDSPWNPAILGNGRVMRLAHRRQQLTDLLERYYELVTETTMDVEDALSAGLIDQASVTALYTLLVDFLNEEECGERLLLYFPLELIPKASFGNIQSEFKTARESFTTTYLQKWRVALERMDIRADFVDGDIPESEVRNGPLQLVVKAAHLVPILIRKGLITRAEIEQIMDTAECETLRESLADALSAEQEHVGERVSPESPARLFGWLVATVRNAQDDIGRAAKRIATQRADAPEARIAWETGKEAGRISHECARLIADTIHAGKLGITDLLHYLIQAENQTVTAIAIAAAYLLLETEAETDVSHARKTYLTLKRGLEKCWREGEEEVREELRSMWLRLVALTVLRESEIREYGMIVPTFDDTDGTMLVPYVGISEAITKNEELSTFLLPIVIAYGSRIKGYGTEKSDIDFAVFVRPGIRLEDRDRINTLLNETLEPFGILGQTLQFWLEDDEGQLKIKDFRTDDRYLGTSVLTHLLFACPWLGDRRSVTRLYEKLLTPYLSLKEVPVFGERTRSIWLEDLESSALLYRLMHKGYYRSCPARRPTIVSEGVPDSDSAFWDSGYRRVATLIFLKKVFLPHVQAE